MDKVTVSKAAELSGLTPGQVSRQIFLGLVRPEHHESYGTGDASILGPRNVRELKLIAKLKKAGIRQDTIESVVKLLANSAVDWWRGDDGYVVAFKDYWVITDNPFSKANLELFKKEGIILLVKL